MLIDLVDTGDYDHDNLHEEISWRYIENKDKLDKLKSQKNMMKDQVERLMKGIKVVEEEIEPAADSDE